MKFNESALCACIMVSSFKPNLEGFKDKAPIIMMHVIVLFRSLVNVSDFLILHRCVIPPYWEQVESCAGRSWE